MFYFWWVKEKSQYHWWFSGTKWISHKEVYTLEDEAGLLEFSIEFLFLYLSTYMNAWFHQISWDFIMLLWAVGVLTLPLPTLTPSCDCMWVQEIPEKVCTQFLRNHSWMLNFIMLWAVSVPTLPDFPPPVLACGCKQFLRKSALISWEIIHECWIASCYELWEGNAAGCTYFNAAHPFCLHTEG